MQTRPLGRTGHDCSVAVLGGIVFHYVPPEAAEELLQEALDAGVTAVDIAPGYGDAELRLGAVLPPYRRRLFVGGKTTARTPSEARADLERTLSRLQVDSLDLYQVHGLLTLDDLTDFGPVLEMMLEAREEGLCRYVGTTGHGLATAAAQAEALRRYGTDTVMLPINPRMAAHEEYWRDLTALLATCAADGVGVLAIKAAARAPWSIPVEERPSTTWYEPETDPDRLLTGIRFALAQPAVAGFCTPGDRAAMSLALAAAQQVTPMTAQEQEAAVAAVADRASLFAPA